MFLYKNVVTWCKGLPVRSWHKQRAGSPTIPKQQRELIQSMMHMTGSGQFDILEKHKTAMVQWQRQISEQPPCFLNTNPWDFDFFLTKKEFLLGVSPERKHLSSITTISCRDGRDESTDYIHCPPWVWEQYNAWVRLYWRVVFHLECQ